MGDLKGGPDELTQTQTATSEVSIPDFLRPFVERSGGVANRTLQGLESRLGNAGADDLVAGFMPDQMQAFGMARQLALGEGSPLALAQQQFADTASGAGFNSDAFNDAFGAAVRRQQPGIISPFIGAGRGTGGLAQAALGQGQADAFAGLFNQERQRQLGAAQALPGIAMAPFGLLSDIGGQQQALQQQQLTAPIQAQQSLLGSAMGGLPVSSLLGSTSTGTQSQPLHSNPWGEALGLGMTGLGIASGLGAFGAPAAASGPLGWQTTVNPASSGMFGGLFS